MNRTALTLIILLQFGLSLTWAALIEIDGQFADWEKIREYPDDEGDTFGGPDDPTMDILSWRVCNDDTFLYVTVVVKDAIANGKTDRGAYQVVLDTDNDYNTGIQSDAETPYPPHERPMGVDRYISVETKQGVYQGVGMQAYAPDANDIGQNLDIPGSITEAVVVGNQYELKADLKSLGVTAPDATIRITILHYSAAGTVDWTMPPLDYTLGDFAMPVQAAGKLATLWGTLKWMR